MRRMKGAGGRARAGAVPFDHDSARKRKSSSVGVSGLRMT